MGFYSPSQLVQDARKCGVTVLQIDINESDWDSTLVYNNAPDEKRMRSNTALRLGLRLINGLAQEQAERIVSVRKHKRYVDIRDVVQRTGITAKEVNALTDADAFRSIAGDRIQSRWIASAARVSDLPLAPSESGEMHDALTPLNLGQDVIADFRSTGLTLRAHPLRLLRPLLRGTYRAEDLKKVTNGQRIRVAGLVTCRQRPGTASGVTFVTLEDETGNTNVVVWRDLAERERRALIASRLMIVHGTLEHQGPITHLVANHMEDASHLLADLMVVSHDFH
jgi:error-prone DNA polymerase